MSAVLIKFPIASRPLPSRTCGSASEVRHEKPVLQSEKAVVWAMEQVEKDLRRHIKDNPRDWHLSEWKLSFITDSRIAAPPIFKLMKAGPY